MFPLAVFKLGLHRATRRKVNKCCELGRNHAWMVLHETIHLCITFRLLLGYLCHWRSSWRRAATKPFFIHGVYTCCLCLAPTRTSLNVSPTGNKVQVTEACCFYRFQFMIETSTPKRTRLDQPRRVNSSLCKISPFHHLALHRTKRHPLQLSFSFKGSKLDCVNSCTCKITIFHCLCSPSNETTSIRHVCGSHSLQRLKARFPSARDSSGHWLFISAFMISSTKAMYDDTYSNNNLGLPRQGKETEINW